MRMVAAVPGRRDWPFFVAGACARLAPDKTLPAIGHGSSPGCRHVRDGERAQRERALRYLLLQHLGLSLRLNGTGIFVGL